MNRRLWTVGLGVGLALVLQGVLQEGQVLNPAWAAKAKSKANVSQKSGSYAQSELRALESNDEKLVRELREQEVNQLRIALGRRIPNNRRADLYFRLAEIYVEAYRSTFILEGRVHEKRLERGSSEKSIDRTHSLPYLGLAIKACNEIIKFKIPYSKLDHIYYFLGFSTGELGKKKESVTYFETLTSKFPNSAFVVEAYRELGDSAFGQSQYRKAIPYYEAAVKKGNSPLLPRVLHRLAWCYYRTKQYERSVETLKEAVQQSNKGGEKFLSLKEEALRDMAIFMTESGKVNEAIAYFQSASGDKAFYPKILERLGKHYERNLEPVKAAQVYESLLKTNPESEASFRVLAKLVDLDLRQGKWNHALSRLKNLKMPEGADAETMTAAQNLKAMIRRTATEHHEKYRKKANKSDLEVSEAFYVAYLNTFLAQSDPRAETPEIQMYLAEVKRSLGKSKEASELYRKVLESKDKRYAKEAGALWTETLTESIKKAQPQAASTQVGLKAGEPSALEKEFVVAADRLQASLGDTNESREAALRAAQIFAGYKGTQKEAISRAKEIIQRWEKSPQALVAARLWIQIYADQADGTDDLKETILELRKMPILMASDSEIGGGKLKSAIVDQEVKLKLGTIAKEEKDKDFNEAAKGYEALAAESKQNEFAEKAFENAVGAYFKAGSPENAERVTLNWLKRFPKSEKAVESCKGTASAFLIQGRFDSAAKLFEKLGREMGDPKSLETAARLYEGSGDVAKSNSLLSAYLELYPKNPNRFKVALAVAESLDALHKDSEASKFYQYCMGGSDDLQAVCGARLGDLFLRNKDIDQAMKVFKNIAGQSNTQANAKKKVNNASPFVGYARFRLAEQLEKTGRFDPLQLPEQQLKKAMNQRLDFLESLSRSYSSTMEAGGPWGSAGLSRLAAWVMRFAQEVDSIPTPAGSTAEAIAKFRKNLEAISIPLKRKAIYTWQDAYQKASNAEALSPVLPEIFDRLIENRSPGLGRAQGAKGHFRLGGIPADGGEPGKETSFKQVREKLVRNSQDAQAWVDYGNLLWGEGKPFLAEIAYERAIALNPQNPAAINNRAVLEVSGDREDEWLRVAEGMNLFQDALKKDPFFLPAKINRALLLNYYRIFSKARALWEQVLLKEQSADVLEGFAVSLQGTADYSGAEAAFKKAVDAGAKENRFQWIYHKAVREASGVNGLSKCADVLEDLKKDIVLSGFEKLAWDALHAICVPKPKATQ